MKPVLAIGLLGFGLAACDILGINGALSDYNGAVTVRILERHGQSGQNANADPVKVLMLATTDTFPCVNYYLSHDVSKSGNTINIDIKGVQKSGVCLTAIGPAAASGVLTLSDGMYNLVVHTGAGTSTFALNITPAAITLTPVSGTSAKAIEPVVYRFPQSSFMFACSEGKLTGGCDEFAEILRQEPGLQPYTFPVGGRIPYVYTTTSDWKVFFFTYQSPANFSRVQDLLRQFDESQHVQSNSARLMVENWRNEATHSWMSD